MTTQETMDFITSLAYAKETGASIVPVRYTDYSKKIVQYYFNDEGQFVVQDSDQKPTFPQMNGNKYFNEHWVAFEGKYEKFYEAQRRELEEFKQLEIEIQPLYDQFKRYEKLKRKLGK